MTAESPGPGPILFSILTGENDRTYHARRETFLLSLLGQAAILGLLIYFTSCVIRSTPEIASRLPKFNELPLVFSGHSGGGGGNHDPLPASHGNLPQGFARSSTDAADRGSSEGTAEASGGGDSGGGSGRSAATGRTNWRSDVAVFSCAVQRAGRSRRNRTRLLRWRRSVNRARIRPRAFGNLSSGKDGRDGAAGDF